MHIIDNIAHATGKRKRKLRCGKCNQCKNVDCGKCKFCLDKPKFGGNGRLKQCCVNRHCTAKGIYFHIYTCMKNY